MSYTEVTSEGCFSRLLGSIGGIIFGLILLAISIAVLFWNEGRAVHMAQSLAEGKSAVKSVASDKVDPANDGKLVHLSGDVKTDEVLKDDHFGVAAEPGSLALRRHVEMYQYKEHKESHTRKKLGGGTETVTTYTYPLEWSDKLENSSTFKEAGHQNPASFPYEQQTWTAQKATLGAFSLPGELLGKLSNYTAVDPKGSDDPHVSPNQGMLCSGNPGAPKVGDVRIRFEQIPSGAYSCVGVQSGQSLSPYTAKAGGNEIYLIRSGSVTAADMFKAEEESNNVMTWVLRAVGAFLMFIAFCMFFGPLQVMADIIPFFGDIFGLGVGLFGCAATVVLSAIVIAVGWIAYRPVLGIGLLVVAGGVLFMGVKAGANRRS